MERFRTQYGDSVGMSVIGWEDDDGPCEIRVDQDRFANMMEAVTTAYPLVHAAIQAPTFENIIQALPAVRNAVVAIASWLKSNDELVGTRVERPCNFPDGTSGNWMIMDGDGGGTTQTGCSRLVAHDQSSY